MTEMTQAEVEKAYHELLEEYGKLIGAYQELYTTFAGVIMTNGGVVVLDKVQMRGLSKHAQIEQATDPNNGQTLIRVVDPEAEGEKNDDVPEG